MITKKHKRSTVQGRKPGPASRILWSGYSLLDGKTPIRVVATGLDGKSNNPKTGSEVQTWILTYDHPSIARNQHNPKDHAICGTGENRCPQAGNSGCYVRNDPLVSIHRAAANGSYGAKARTAQELTEIGRNRTIRIGSFGDPDAVPAYVWDALLAKASAHTGYTHQWRRSAALKDTCMASVETPEQAAQAQSMGWRTFRTAPKGGQPLPGEILCPASPEAGHKTTCAKCKLCSGASSKAKISIMIPVHGPTANRASLNVAGPTM